MAQDITILIETLVDMCHLQEVLLGAAFRAVYS